MSFEPFYVRTSEARARQKQTIPFDYPSGSPLVPFEIVDPFGLRKAIVPVFRREPDGRIFGMGTAFHVDGWGGFLTADHVIDFHREALPLRTLNLTRATKLDPSKSSHAVLFLGLGLVYGKVAIPPWAFAHVVDLHTAVIPREDPMAELRGESSIQAVADIAHLQAIFDKEAILPYSVPVRLEGWIPTIGEHVFAVGYPQLDCTEVADSKLFTLKEGLHGAYGRITNFFPKGREKSNITPVFEIEGDWKSGMSGGPVFNRHGDVIGIVSRSLSSTDELSGVGYAACLGSIPSVRQLAPFLDVLNPNWRTGYGVLCRDPWHLAGVCKTSTEAHQLAASEGESYLGALKPAS